MEWGTISWYNKMHDNFLPSSERRRRVPERTPWFGLDKVHDRIHTQHGSKPSPALCEALWLRPMRGLPSMSTCTSARSTCLTPPSLYGPWWTMQSIAIFSAVYSSCYGNPSGLIAVRSHGIELRRMMWTRIGWPGASPDMIRLGSMQWTMINSQEDFWESNRSFIRYMALFWICFWIIELLLKYSSCQSYKKRYRDQGPRCEDSKDF